MSRKMDLQVQVAAVLPHLAGVVGTLSVAACEALLAGAGVASPAVRDGPLASPVTVFYDGGKRFVAVAVERYRGRVRCGIRRGWLNEAGEPQTVLSATKTPYLDGAQQVRDIAAALLAAADVMPE